MSLAFGFDAAAASFSLHSISLCHLSKSACPIPVTATVLMSIRLPTGINSLVSRIEPEVWLPWYFLKYRCHADNVNPYNEAFVLLSFAYCFAQIWLLGGNRLPLMNTAYHASIFDAFTFKLMRTALSPCKDKTTWFVIYPLFQASNVGTI